MAGKTPNEEPKTTPNEGPPEEPMTIQADPILVRQQQLQQEFEQLSGSLLNLKQQKTIVEDRIYNTTMQMAGVQRAAKELAELQKT